MGLREKLFGIAWGVHPDDHKRPAADVPLRTLPIPERLNIPLIQHVGAPARPVVKVGDRVLRGQLIAAAQGNVSSPVHASTSGRVAAIGEITAPHASGLSFPGITIEADGEGREVEPACVGDPFALSPAEIASIVGRAGVVGLGGATFPSAVKFALGLRLKVDTLIVNGGECEPYLSSDDRTMRDRAHEVVDGIRIIMHAIGAREALVGIENNKPEAIEAMRVAATPFSDVKIRPVPARYPMGSDKQLIQTLTGREVPANARAATVGVLVHNVSTCAAVHRAVRFGTPLIERIVTVNGSAIAAPGNLVVPIGTPVQRLIEFCGVKEGHAGPARLILGGPMMGMTLPHGEVPTVKGCGGVLGLDALEAQLPEPSPCIRCGSCVSACPMGLLPLEMSARVRMRDYHAAEQFGLDDCIACGCCAYACPSHIPLVQLFNHAKGEIWVRAQEAKRHERFRTYAASRKERLEREARERQEAAARRKAAKAVQAAAGAAANPAQKDAQA